jgi:hypothetical protein
METVTLTLTQEELAALVSALDSESRACGTHGAQAAGLGNDVMARALFLKADTLTALWARLVALQTPEEWAEKGHPAPPAGGCRH